MPRPGGHDTRVLVAWALREASRMVRNPPRTRGLLDAEGFDSSRFRAAAVWVPERE